MKHKRPTVTFAEPDAVITIEKISQMPGFEDTTEDTAQPPLFIGYYPTSEPPAELWLMQGRLIKIVYTPPPTLPEASDWKLEAALGHTPPTTDTDAETQRIYHYSNMIGTKRNHDLAKKKEEAKP